MAENFDSNVYCEFPEAVAKAGKDILLCLFTADGAKLLAIAGQQSLTLNRSADTIETNAMRFSCLNMSQDTPARMRPTPLIMPATTAGPAARPSKQLS